MTITNIEAVENAGLEVVYTLQNGVKKFPLLVENDFKEAQDMLDICDLTDGYDAEITFNDRPSNSFCGTYEFKVENKESYNAFVRMFDNVVQPLKNKAYTIKRACKDVVFDYYHAGKINRVDAGNWLDILNDKVDFERYAEISPDEEKMLSFRLPTIEEWQSGKYKESEKRESRLGKALLKNKFPQSLVDFYSQQIKTTDKVLYLTISDRVQHITGMSNYVDLDGEYRFDGYQNSSCQDTRHGFEEVYKLGASLHDDKLFIAMLHFELEDVKDMQDKLIARTILRYIHVDGKPCLVGTTLYGLNTTKQWLTDGLNSLNEMDIYNSLNYGDDRIQEDANGSCTRYMMDEIEVCETIDEYVTVDCPFCNGSGDYEVYSHRLDRHVEVDCPCCGGSGELEANVYREIDETIEVENEMEVLPYNEGYSHYGNHIRINVDLNIIRKNRSKYNINAKYCNECEESNEECTCLDFD